MFLSLLFGIFLIGFVSAAFYYGGGNSLGDLLNSFDSTTVTLATFFLIAFVLIFFALVKTIFKDYRGLAAIIAGAASFLLIFELNRRGYAYDIGSIFTGFGYSGDLSLITPLIFLILAVIIIFKFGFAEFSLVLGFFLAVVSIFTDWVYEKTATFILGMVFIIIGGLILKFRREKADLMVDFRRRK